MTGNSTIDINATGSNWRSDDLAKLAELALTNSSAQLVVTQSGKTILDAVSNHKPVDVYAVQKGLMSLLIGIAEEKYLLETCDAINHHLEPEWTNLSPWTEASLTIETLLAMKTGMDDELNELGSVNETWRYNNTAYNYLKKILCLHTGLTLNELTREWLLEPLGMSRTEWVDRSQRLPDGTHYSGLMSTAEDLAKLGNLVLNKGVVGDSQIIPAHYLSQMTKPGSRGNPAWGLCWWNNNQSFHRIPFREDKIIEGKILPQAPDDLVAARGLLENCLYVVPSLKLVVARTVLPRDPTEKKPRIENALWDYLMESKLQTLD